MNNFELGFGKTGHELQLDQLPVRGRLPDWLRGTLIRNGPGTFQVGQERFRHWFDGLSMLHKFTIAGGNVAYANRFLDTQAYRSAMQEERITYSEFATDPCQTLFGRVKTVFNPRITDDAKVSITRIGDQYLALAETPIQVEFDPETLRTVGVHNYETKLSGQMTTVHPQFDFSRGQVFNLVTRYHQVSHYNIYSIENLAKPKQIASIPVNQPAYLHSFGMTENYFIIAEFPLVVNPLRLLLWLAPYIENFRWKPSRGSAFWIIDRQTGQVVRRLESDPFFAFHHVNAFERGDEIVLDIDAYPDASILKAYYLDSLANPTTELPFGNLRRYRLPLKGKRADYEIISPSCLELANFDYARFNMSGDYRFVYAASIDPDHRQGFYNQVLKVDLQTRQEWTWKQPECYPGEPIFVGRPGRTDEDDGVILSVALNADQGNSFLVVLDARNLEEIARAEIPQPVLFGYHGAYFPQGNRQ
jgi:carotenoid cleavage dioxygenase-like enzyme